jgi:PAS domain S-box-containing protein
MSTPIDYKSVFQTLPEHYVVFDVKKPGFTIVAANDRYLAVTNQHENELIGKKLFEVFPDTSESARNTGKGELERSLENVIRTNKPDDTGVIRYDLKDEKGILEVRYWKATHYPYFENDTLVAIVQSTSDVTELVRSEEQLKLANMKLEDALQAGLIGSWTWDVSSDRVIADKGLATLFGLEYAQVSDGLPIDDFINAIHEDDRPRVVEEINRTVESGVVFESEYRTVDAHGKLRWVIARGKVERNDEGGAIRFPGVMIDISSRKKSEFELKESEQRLRFIADTMPQLVWITDAEGNHEYFNKHWYDFTGTSEGDTNGPNWIELLHEADRRRSGKVWRKSLETGEPYEVKYRLYNAPSKTYHWVIGRALPFKNEDGVVTKWYGTSTDIDDSIKELELRRRLEQELQDEKNRLESRVTERTSQLKLTNEGLRDEIRKRQNAEAKLRTYSEELARSNKELEEFAYVSSHDLQEPLRKIQSFSDLLVEEYSTQLDDGKEYLDRISSSAKRMSTLIEDLLTFSRVTTKPMIAKPIDLGDVLDMTVSDLHERIKKENGVVRVQDNMPTVLADETHMRQLFQNLIGNALKFHAPDVHPVVEVNATIQDDECHITVKDNGIGIDEKYAGKIFAVFQRLNSKHSYEGTGIGLAVCKKIVERYGGTIQVDSTVGVGTTFKITLPVQYEETT